MKLFLYVVLFGLPGLLLAADTGQSDTQSPAADSTTITETTTTETMDTDKGSTETMSSETVTTESVTTEEAKNEQAGFSRGSVVRSVFTTGIQEREPVDKLNNTDAEEQQVYYFTELRDMSGQTAIHRWEKDGDVKAEVKFDVRGPRWRVWSSKTFQPTSTGEWKVSVLNGAGEVIAEETLNLVAVDQPAEASSQNAPAEQTEQPSEQPFEPPVNENMMQ